MQKDAYIYKSKRAFSLVELSIVLVILGLLTGSILAGQSLIRAAELRSVSTQFNQFISATQTFRDKYLALPGDMPNATRFWGEAHATPATCRTTASTSALTCNGNGDGQVIDSTTSNEAYRFWQQLANAGLIEGTYSGISKVPQATPPRQPIHPRAKLVTLTGLHGIGNRQGPALVSYLIRDMITFFR